MNFVQNFSHRAKAAWNRMLYRRMVATTSDFPPAFSEKPNQSHDNLASTLNAIPDLMFELDAEGRHLDFRALKPELLVAPPEDLLGHTVSEVMPEEAAQAVMAALEEASMNGTSQGAQLFLPTPMGERWFEVSIACKNKKEGEDSRFIVLSRDITERKKAQAETEYLAFYDALTDLPNRRLLRDRLQIAVKTSARNGSYGALLFLDLDNFKTLNDTKGHGAGDLLLQQVAQRLCSSVREEDSVARWGGDEFVVMLQGLNNDDASAATQVNLIGEQMINRLNIPYELDGYEHSCTASIGASLFGGKAQDIDELIKFADTAMYSAKNSGRNKLVFFNETTQTALVERAQLHSELNTALQEEQFQLYCQVQMDGARQMTGVESQLRWQHPRRGLILPKNFIHLAEHNNLIVLINQWVLDHACAQLKHWQNNEHTNALPLSVNCCVPQFHHQDFVEQVREVLQRTEIDPGKLQLDVPENLLKNGIESVINTMQALKALGVRLSINEFGTGHSSLPDLYRLPLDQIKIDQSFVRDITTNEGSTFIIKTIVSMAHNLRIEVLAEGIETEAQRSLLLEYGCQVFQGELFGQAILLSEFEGTV